MRRISSLPVAEFCPKADSIGEDIETTNALRSTIFHRYAETGIWPDDIHRLPENDIEEIKRWKVPEWIKVKDGDNEVKVHYRDAFKEVRVALDEDFNYIDVPIEVPVNEISSKFPNVLCAGHLDIGWDVPSLDLVIVSDIKSSVFAVKARTKSLQLHGYGIGFAKRMARSRYIVDIWDANDGLHYLDNEIVRLDSFECEEYKGRIREASKNREGGFVRGSHCSGCWKRDSCPAHIVDIPESDNRFAKVLSGKCSEADVREALIAAKGLQSLYAKVKDACESWTVRHGPVRSEDGLKCWRPALRSGKKSLDTAAVAEALGKPDLKEFMTEGNPFQVFDWVNVKK